MKPLSWNVFLEHSQYVSQYENMKKKKTRKKLFNTHNMSQRWVCQRSPASTLSSSYPSFPLLLLESVFFKREKFKLYNSSFCLILSTFLHQVVKYPSSTFLFMLFVEIISPGLIFRKRQSQRIVLGILLPNIWIIFSMHISGQMTDCWFFFPILNFKVLPPLESPKAFWQQEKFVGFITRNKIVSNWDKLCCETSTRSI